jgi:hypothetical protein
VVREREEFPLDVLQLLFSEKTGDRHATGIPDRKSVPGLNQRPADLALIQQLSPDGELKRGAKFTFWEGA